MRKSFAQRSTSEQSGAAPDSIETTSDGAPGSATSMGTPHDGPGGAPAESSGDIGAATGGGEVGSEGGGGEASGAGDTAVPSEAAVCIVDGGEDTSREYEAGAYTEFISISDGVVSIEGLDLQSELYAFNGLVATGSSSTVRLEDCLMKLGATDTATDDDTGGTAVAVGDGATLYLTNCDLEVDGAARYVTAVYDDSTLVVNNSSVTSTGTNEATSGVSEPFSNEALLISGTARANFSIGASKTYYFNSTCTAEGWAALSTDSATGDGLNLYAYATTATAQNGGYGSYADTNCHVWLYGSNLSSAEIGCIISKNGQITLEDAASVPEDVLSFNEGATSDASGSITAGRNAVMIHCPDMQGTGVSAADCGSFSAAHTSLVTSSDLVSTKDYSDYSDAVLAYVNYVSGSDILVRSTSADIDLDDVQMESSNGVLVQSVLSADSMGNFLAAGDGDTVDPISVTMTDMDVVGDIRHEDYQRRMTVDLEGTTLQGTLSASTMEDWNATWSDYGDVNWVVDTSYDATYGISLTLGDGSAWKATGTSNLTSLTVADGATLVGDVTVDGEDVTPEAGKTYNGVIVVCGSAASEAREEATSKSAASVAGSAATAEATGGFDASSPVFLVAFGALAFLVGVYFSHRRHHRHGDSK